MAAAQYIIQHEFSPPIIYTDSLTALTWFRNKKTASKKRTVDLQRAEIFLKIMASEVNKITVIHWDTLQWGEMIMRVIRIAGVEKLLIYKSGQSILADDRIELHSSPQKYSLPD